MAWHAHPLRTGLCNALCPPRFVPMREGQQLSGPQSIEMYNTPPGMGHVREVLRRMYELAEKGQHDYRIRQLATRITHHVPSKAPTREIFAIYKWVRDHIRYRMDPVKLELVQAPHITLEELAGDCDDITVLICALCGALGHPWRARTVGPSPTDQAHVQAQVFDRKRWIDVDPVLEPEQLTTAPRDDVGMFAMFAGGHDHLWDREGRMLAGRPRRPRRTVHVAAHQRGWPRLDGLGAPATAVERSLWQWCAYYPPWGAAFEHSGGQPPQPGVWTVPDARYRSGGAPGYMPSVMPSNVYYAFHENSLPAQAHTLGWFGPVHHPELGAGFFKKLGRGIKKGAKAVGGGLKKGVTAVTKGAHAVTHGKKSPIAKIHKGITSVAKKIPVLAPFVQLQEDVFGAGTKAVLHKAGLINEPGAKMPTMKKLKSSIPAAAAAASSSGAGNIPAVRAAGAATANVRAAGARLKAATQKPVKALKAKAPKSSKPAIPMKDAWKKPHPELRRKYPASARMLFDPGSKRFRVFIPKPRGAAALHGLGRISPTISFSIGAAPATPAQIEAAKQAALKMEVALHAFIQKKGRPPAVSLPAVLVFQKAEGTLKQDGLYGDNTKAAGEYYAGHKLPAHAPALKSKSGLTWKPPAQVVATPSGQTVVVQPKPPPNPPPAPVVVPGPTGQPTVVTPVQTDVVPVPSGYTEVGREANNPGLPPIGAPTDTKTGTAVASKPDKVVTTLPPPGPVTTQRDMEQARGGGGKRAPVVVNTPAGPAIVDTSTPVYVPSGPALQDDALPDDITPSTPPVYPYDVDPNYGMPAESDDRTWLWLLAYVLYRNSKKRAA